MFSSKKVNKSLIYKKGIGAGVAEIIYIILLVLLMTFLDRFMSKSASGALAMLSVLILFVFSAAVSGFFIFAYPIYLALEKKYQQAILTLLTTLLTLLAGCVIVLVVIFLV